MRWGSHRDMRPWQHFILFKFGIVHTELQIAQAKSADVQDRVPLRRRAIPSDPLPIGAELPDE